MKSIILSDELELVAPDLNYVKDLHALITQEKERLSEWLPWAHNYGTVENSIAYTELTHRNFEEKKSFGFTILFKNKPVGKIGTHAIDYTNKRTTIGYWLSKEAEGKGVMTQCVKGLLQFCFDEINLNRVELLCGTKNIRSKRIAQKLNFELEGVFKQYELLPNGFVDVNYYALLKENWKK